ncbi:hypothetical protein QTP86_027891 [Hemibagrus guttatus]|nr:hypothetical protein QTP86_027891 [Hemibagrus guttatus]
MLHPWEWRGEPPVIHPCAFFSKKLSPVEQNYDIGNRELLAIKLALEEWRHWLEGANHPIEVITDHKDKLIGRHFLPALTSQSPTVHPMSEEPEPMLHPDLFVCPITWLLDEDIHAATEEELAPPGLSTCVSGIWPPRQAANPLTPQEKPWKQQRPSSTTSSDTLAFLRASCLIGGLNSSPGYGVDSVGCSECRKLSPSYIGPFSILRQINKGTYELQLPSHYHISPTFHVSLLKPITDPVLPPSTEPEVPPAPEIDTDDTVYWKS